MYTFLVLLLAYPCNSSNLTIRNTSIALESRIYSGYDVDISRYPFAVFLHFDGTHPSSCGSSLIMVQAVITAAHCVDELRYKRGRVIAYLGATVPKKSRVVRRVWDYLIHPNYNERKGRTNIAVAFLEHTVPLSNLIQKIPLSTMDPAENSVVFSAGWGRQAITEYNYQVTDIAWWRKLQASKQKFVSKKLCTQYAEFILSPPSICTTPEIGHQHIDDSGNGLVLRTPSPVLIGVLSFLSEGVNIYTSVYGTRGWIIKALYDLYERNCDNNTKK